MKSTVSVILIGVGITAISMVGNTSKGSYSAYHVSSIQLNTGGSPSGRTGAPGEATCTSCHNGSVLDGNAGINSLTLTAGGTEYVPDAVNSMQLTFNDASSKNGFQLVVLNEAEEMAGSLAVSDVTNTKFVTSAFLNREYITHTSNGTTLSTWTFDWSAPSSGDVTFYVATNRTNANAQNTGDVVYVSEHTFNAPSSANVVADEIDIVPFIVGYNPDTQQAFLDFTVNQKEELYINVADMNGKSVFFERLGSYAPGNYSNKVHLDHLEKGMYTVTLFMNNKPFSGKIYIQ